MPIAPLLLVPPVSQWWSGGRGFGIGECALPFFFPLDPSLELLAVPHIPDEWTFKDDNDGSATHACDIIDR